MSSITLKGNAINTCGNLPRVGDKAPDFELVSTDLKEVHLSDYQGKKKILNVFPSLDTGVCANSVRQFNKKAAENTNAAVLCISADLPFAHKRFCAAEGIDRAECLSTFRSDFPRKYGLQIEDSPLRGLCSRAVIVLDENDKVVYAEQVPEIAQEPDYARALAAL